MEIAWRGWHERLMGVTRPSGEENYTFGLRGGGESLHDSSGFELGLIAWSGTG